MWLAYLRSVAVLSGLTNAVSLYSVAEQSTSPTTLITHHGRAGASSIDEPYNPTPSMIDWVSVYSSDISLTPTTWVPTRQSLPIDATRIVHTDIPVVRRIGHADCLEARSDDEVQSIVCTGSDMDKRGEVAACSDGSYLPWSGKDCAKHCSCDGDKIDCDIPDDCGPKRDVNAYCAVAGTFTCQCPQKKYFARQSATKGIEVSTLATSDALVTVHTSKEYELKYQGPDLRTVLDLEQCDNPATTVWLTGAYCRDHCRCNRDMAIACMSDGLHQDVDQCGENDHIRRFCGRDAREEFQCYCVDRDEREKVAESTPRSTVEVKATPVAYSVDFGDELSCEGADMLKTGSIGKYENPSLGIYLNGYYCQSHCKCDRDKIRCMSGGLPEGINECGGDTAATR